MIILHCALKTDWEDAIQTGKYGAELIEKNGFIPCMNATDITPENFSFPSTKNYVILCINTDKISSEIKSESINLNIYGTIDTSAVASTLDYIFDNDDKFVVSQEIKDITIINEVLDKLNIKYTSHKYFRDGTTSRIIDVNDELIIKQNIPSLLKSEVLFSEYNKTPKLQNVLYTDENYKYIVYNFIPGDVMHTVEDVNDLISNIKELVSSFKDYDGEEFGYVYEPCNSWIDFLKTIVHDSSITLPESLNYLPQVYDSISVLEKYSFKKKLIHGDFGTHNFIKQNGKFVGAIDPVPIAGDASYDLFFALVSNVDLLNHLSIDFLCEISGEPREKVTALLTVVLFYRLATCLRHHKEDFDTYVDFWYRIIG